MKIFINILLTGLVAVILSKILSGVLIDGYVTAIIVALVLALLNFTVKPIIAILTLPITLITFGLFLLIINAIIILLVDHFVPGFSVVNFWWALLFSILLSFLQYFFESLISPD